MILEIYIVFKNKVCVQGSSDLRRLGTYKQPSNEIVIYFDVDIYSVVN